MKTKIPSPVLARIQLLFQSGATMDEVTAALDLDTTWQQAEQVVSENIPQPVIAPQPVSAQPRASDAVLPKLEELSAKMEEHVSRLLERDDIRDVPALAGALDSIYQHVNAIRSEVKSPTVGDVANVASAKPAAALKPAPKRAAPKAAKSAASAAPPPIKVQPPKKKNAPEKLQPTGELPSVGRRNLVHPLQAKPLAASEPAKKMAAPLPAKPQSIQSPSRPNDEYRDRIALAMSEISIFDDDHGRDEDRLTARNS